MTYNFFETSLGQTDADVFHILQKELHRQQNHIELIASENIVSRAVLQAMGSVMTNKYAEGYSAHRYYNGCEFMDEVEDLAIERAKKLFNAAFVNVQPHSGSQANGAVYLALMQPGEVLMGMSLDAGGHLTHGAKPSSSGKYYTAVQYGIDADGYIDYDQVETLAKTHHPKVIVAGGSAYPRKVDFKKFRAIADSVGAYLMVDMAHFAGLVAAGLYENPVDIADVVTTTTHKTLRGPRGGMILTNNPEIAKKINSAIFPGLQGGPLMHIISAKAVAFKEALDPSFKTYARQVMSNANALGSRLQARGFNLVSGGTDTHLILVDLRSKGLKGNASCDILAQAGIVGNKNAVPHDPEKPSITSGMRLGTPACTTRGFTEKEFTDVADMIADVLDAYAAEPNSLQTAQVVKQKVEQLCARFPIYKDVL